MEPKYSQKKKILIVSFHFPPHAEVSVMRPLKLCKYLPENGWTPVVITVDERYYQNHIVANPSKYLKTIQLLRLPFIPFPKSRKIASFLFPLYVLYQVCIIRKKIDAICMIGSPFHPFILSPVFSKLLRIPTGLDFRDSWSNNFGYDGTDRRNVSFFVRMLHHFFFLIERIGIRYASVVSFASPVLKKEYAELHPEYKSKYHVILNGYDPDDFKDLMPVSPVKGKCILLAGKFIAYTPEAVSIFFEILRHRDDLTFVYIGNEIEKINKIALKQGVQDKVILKPYLPYNEVLSYIKGSDYCLLATGRVDGIGTKIFDYFALGKPMLCLVPQGSIISDIFCDAEGVVICERPFTFCKLEAKIDQLLSLDQGEHTAFVEQFSRKKSTRKFAELYHRLLR